MKLIGKVAGVSLTLDGKPLVTFEIESKEIPEFTDEKCTIEVKKYREKRSLDANAYAWVLIGKIAQAVGMSSKDVYRQEIRDAGVYTVGCLREKDVERTCAEWSAKGMGWITEVEDSKLDGCKNVYFYVGSSSYDTKEMSVLIDNIVSDAKDLGIETATPEELSRMVSEWR